MQRHGSKHEFGFLILLSLMILAPVCGVLVYQTWNSKPEPGQRFIADISPEAKLELLGVANPTTGSTKRVWWRANGERLPEDCFPQVGDVAGVLTFQFRFTQTDRLVSNLRTVRLVVEDSATGGYSCGSHRESVPNGSVGFYSLNFLPTAKFWPTTGFEAWIASRGTEVVDSLSDKAAATEFVISGCRVTLKFEDSDGRQGATGRILRLEWGDDKPANLNLDLRFIDNTNDQPIYDFQQTSWNTGRHFMVGSATDFTVEVIKTLYDQEVSFNNISTRPGSFSQPAVSAVLPWTAK